MNDWFKKLFIDEAKPALERHSGGDSGDSGGEDMLQQTINIIKKCDNLFTSATGDFSFLKQLDTSKVSSAKSMFYKANITDIELQGKFDNAIITNMFSYATMPFSVFEKILNSIDYTTTSNISYLFKGVTVTNDIIENQHITLDLKNCTDISSMFSGDNSSDFKLPSDIYLTLLNTEHITNMSNFLYRNENIFIENELDLHNCTNFNQAFYNTRGHSLDCQILLKNTSNITNWSNAFRGAQVGTLKEIDLKNATNVQYMFYSISWLTNLIIKNIKLDLQIGSGTSWGHQLTLDSLLNTCQECVNVNAARTLTVGSKNLEKLASVYVKLTGEAEEDESNPKLPMVQCESTDEGAMTITDYMTLKGWTLQ